jgi:photosystem II stability/assembly factor-like uncharacterized protein
MQAIRSESSAAGSRRRSPLVRVLSFGAALVLFAVSSFIAFRQEPRLDAYLRPSPLAAEWWWHPIERNAPRRLPLVWGNLNDVFALRGKDAGKVWVVGEGGLVLHSDDYGRHWTRQLLVRPAAPAAGRAAAWLRRLAPSDPLAALTLLAMVPSRGPTKGPPVPQDSANAPPRPPPQQQAPLPAPAPRLPLAELARSTLWSVQFVDDRYGWVAGDGGALFATMNGGESWERRDAAVPFVLDLMEVTFTDRRRGLLVGRSGVFLETADGGRTWANSIIDRSVVRGFKAGWRQMAAAANQEPPETLSRRLRMFASVPFQNATRGAVDNDVVGDRAWALAADGALNRTGDGTIWVRSRVAAPSPLAAIRFADPEHGWIAGGDGTLLATEDGGGTWFRQSRNAPALGIDSAANAAVMRREQGRFGPYSIWPAPWYGLSLLLVALLLTPALKTPPPYVDPSPSVASLLISDRPIERGEADVFDFNAVALGLSRFLRNEKTEPPLTIAVTGEWGSGKSSLMNLLRGDLRRYGFRPVWFNAWHHQKEDNLLASLLEAVRAQAIPAVWRPEGMTYRLRLLGIRWLRYWPVVALLLLAFSVSAGYLRSDPRRVDQAQGLVDSWGDRIGRVSEVLAGHSAAAPAKSSPVSPSAPAPSSAPPSGIQPPPAPAGQHVPVAGLLLSALGLAVSIWKGAKGFGVDPASLLAHDSGRIRDLQALTGFRQRFAAEFGDVTRALNPRTMLILIDDLDRCRPENVIEVLEAVNFLVSSGDCFVVLGMARERVVRCVGLSFKDVADELLDSPAAVGAPEAAAPEAGAPEAETPKSPPITAADLARQRRLEFGQQYLEKLINIEVPVPVPTDVQSRRLLAAGEAAEETPEARRRRRRHEVWTWARRLLPVAGFAALLAAGFYYGLTRPPEPRPPVAAPPAPQAGAPSTLPSAPAGLPAPASRQLPEPSLGERPHWTHWPLAILAILLVGLGAWRLSIPPDVVIRDSQEFELALATWHPLLFAWRNTPRSIKRYLNRVRYLAMLQRAPVREPALSRRLIDSLARRWQRWRKRPEPAAASPVPLSPLAPDTERPFIPEDFLVALSAIDCCRPELLRSRSGLDAFLGSGLHEESLPEAIGKLAADPAWNGRLESFRCRYLEMASGIHAS